MWCLLFGILARNYWILAIIFIDNIPFILHSEFFPAAVAGIFLFLFIYDEIGFLANVLLSVGDHQFIIINLFLSKYPVILGFSWIFFLEPKPLRLEF